MNTSWLKRSGIQKDDQSPTEGVEAAAGEGAEVKNDKATPVVGNERGIPSVNQSGFRSRALPLSLTI